MIVAVPFFVRQVMMPEQNDQSETVSALIEDIEEKAAELEVTVDYYIAEFM
jgi:hypothetical protein